jgi:2-oxoglutarate/2-oxoacid ferredoxin oxidoreductase subunit beta
VARELAVNVPSLTQRIIEAVNHPGFAVIDVLQPCLVFNPKMDAQWYLNNIVKLTESPDFDSKNKLTAYREAIRPDKLAVGLFWQDQHSVPYHQTDVTLKNGPLIKHSLQNIDLTKLLEPYA